MQTLIAFATEWGSSYGGINSFNTDFLSAFGVAYHSSVQVVCIVANATDVQREEARNAHVCLVPLPFPPKEKILSAAHAQSAIKELESLNISFTPDETIWLGHDRITGEAANSAAKTAGGRSALIHHMSYDHYESFAENSRTAYEKTQTQKALFQAADVVLAVGPLLRDALSDLLAVSKPVHMLIPGLAEIKARCAPKTFTVFMSGRLSDDAARIKQSHLGLAAFSQAHRDACNNGMPDGLCDKPKLVLRGVDFESALSGEQLLSQKDPETELKKFAEEYAECVINLHALPYTLDRQMLYGDLSSSSMALMPSWHEGFGLVAWEAIAAGVPLILSKDSGVYRLLEENYPGAAKGCTYPIDIKGSVSFPFFRTEDLQSLVGKLKEIANKPGEARKRAGNLRGQLLVDNTWTACAEQAAKAFDWLLHQGSIQTVVVAPSLSDVSIQPPEASVPISTSPLQMPIKHWKRDIGMADSRLLRAEEELVPFDLARQPELDVLNDWLDDLQYPQAVRLMTGAGGVGKTRLALELCRQRLELGWHAGFLNAYFEDRDLVTAWQAKRNLNHPQLIVIDYAETRQTTLLSLINAIMNDRGVQPVRILLLARGGGEWWDNLPSRDSNCEPLLCGYATTGPFCLPALHPTERDRRDAYQLALLTFAQALGVVAPDVVPSLEGEHFERPLFLQMAALLALYGERPTTAEGLTRALLNHERRYWRRLLARFKGAIPERYVQQLLTLSTLTGGLATPKVALSLLRTASVNPLRDAVFSELFYALMPLYPGKQGLQAVRPDLLGEALVAHALLCPEAADLLDAVLSSSASNSVRRHTLTVIARLFAQRSDLHMTLMEALIRNFNHCYTEIIEVAIETNGQLLPLAEKAFACLVPAQKSQVAGLLEPLIREESIQLSRLGCQVTEYLVEKFHHKYSKKTNCVETMINYADALLNHSINLSRIGRAEDSLSCAKEALDHFDKLSPKNKIRFESMYSTILGNYANCLRNVGKYEKALTYYQMSITNRPRPSQKNSDRYESENSKLLSNYATSLSDAGRYEEALTYALQSLEIYQRLSQKNSDRYESEYAKSLNNCATSLSDAGRYEEALTYALQSLEIYQSLSQKNSDRYESGYAMSLNNYANSLSDAGRYEEALMHAMQSLEIYQRLSQKNPDRYESGYAMSLNNYANSLSYAGRYEEALTYAMQALEFYQCLTQKNPDRYESDHAMSLNTYANLLSVVGRYEEALMHAMQSLEICQRLSQKNPDRYESGYAMSLNNYANYLSNMGWYEEVQAYANQSLQIYQHLATKNPIRFDEKVFNVKCSVHFHNWLYNSSVDVDDKADSCDLPSTIRAHHRSLFRLYFAFVQACQTTECAERTGDFAQVLSTWGGLSVAEQIQLQPYRLCAAAWCTSNAPHLVVGLDWQADLNKFARQRQGNLPQWMHTVAQRLEFSFDSAQNDAVARSVS